MITEDNFEMCFRLQITRLATKRVKKVILKCVFDLKLANL